MKAFKADVKEKVQNVAAKREEVKELSKASATNKAETKNAENKAEKLDAKGNYHTRQAEIRGAYEQKKANNIAAKEQTKTAFHQQKADKHTDKAEDHANINGSIIGDGTTDDTGAATPAGVTQEEFDDRNTSNMNDMDGTTPTDAANLDDGPATDASMSDLVRHSQVPMHGSGVPTHSTLHSKGNPDIGEHDKNTTQTMGGSPNTGSYM